MMFYQILKRLTLIPLSVLAAIAVAEDSTEIRKYSYASLSRFWDNTLQVNNMPDSARFASLLDSSGNGFGAVEGDENGCEDDRTCGTWSGDEGEEAR